MIRIKEKIPKASDNITNYLLDIVILAISQILYKNYLTTVIFINWLSTYKCYNKYICVNNQTILNYIFFVVMFSKTLVYYYFKIYRNIVSKFSDSQVQRQA